MRKCEWLTNAVGYSPILIARASKAQIKPAPCLLASDAHTCSRHPASDLIQLFRESFHDAAQSDFIHLISDLVDLVLGGKPHVFELRVFQKLDYVWVEHFGPFSRQDLHP